MTMHQYSVVFGLCSLINLVLIAVSWLIILKARTWAYSIHSKWFPITEEQFNMAIYCFFGLYKVLIIVFNIVPWIACTLPEWF